jgi:nucleoside-diphosphate-sugar epimerase
VAGAVFNIGGGERISVNTLWRLIGDAVGTSLEPAHGAPRAGDVRDSLADLQAARMRLGYRVMVPLAEGLRRTAEALSQGLSVG